MKSLWRVSRSGHLETYRLEENAFVSKLIFPYARKPLKPNQTKALQRAQPATTKGLNLRAHWSKIAVLKRRGHLF